MAIIKEITDQDFDKEVLTMGVISHKFLKKLAHIRLYDNRVELETLFDQGKGDSGQCHRDRFLYIENTLGAIPYCRQCLMKGKYVVK